MKKIFLVLALTLLPFALFAQDAPAAQPAAEDAAAKAAEDKAKTLYTMGYLMGDSVKSNLIIENEDEFKYISQGMRDSLTGKSAQADLDAYKPMVIKRYQDDSKRINEKRAVEQKRFLSSAKKERNTKEIDNGILVQTLTRGKGASPTVDSTVKVHYHGTLTDGKVFDSSVIRGEAAEFPLSGVIPCWTKGLQEMKQGGKAKLVCPPDTAYANRQVGSIPPNSVLVFEVELLEVK